MDSVTCPLNNWAQLSVVSPIPGDQVVWKCFAIECCRTAKHLWMLSFKWCQKSFLVLVLIIRNLSYFIWVWLTLLYFALQVNFKLSFQNHSNDFTETHILKVSSLNGRRDFFLKTGDTPALYSRTCIIDKL